MGLFHGLRIVNHRIGLGRRKHIELPPNLLRQNLLRGIAHRKGLGNKLGQCAIVEPRRQRIDGHDPPGGHRAGIRRFKHRVCYAVAAVVSGDHTVKDVFRAILQCLCCEFGIKKGQIDAPGVIRHRHLGQVHSLSDMGRPGCGHDHGPEAGGHIRLELGDGHQLRPVLIASGKMADQVPQSKDIQIFQLLCPGRAYALQACHWIG